MSESRVFSCSICGKTYLRKHPLPDRMCQGCYMYFKNGGTINAPPPAGVIAYDRRGYVICHICGRAYKKLGSHLKESHIISMSEYKERFGLNRNAVMTEKGYHDRMVSLAKQYETEKYLLVAGKNTRFKAGNPVKKGQEARLQTRIAMKERANKQHGH